MLISGTGADKMWGDAATVDGTALTGADLFVFDPESALDQLLDFEQDKDLIDVSGYGFDGFADLDIVEAGGSSFVSFDGAGTANSTALNQVEVVGVTGLVETDFIFEPIDSYYIV